MCPSTDVAIIVRTESDVRIRHMYRYNKKMNRLFDVAGKTAVVTGGSYGIGYMIAAGLIANGCKVYLCSRRDDAVNEALGKLNAVKPGMAYGLSVDLSKESGCRSLVDWVSKSESKVHILVNNAGCNWAAPLDQFPDSAFDKVMALNVKSVFHCTRLFAPLLESAGTPLSPASVVNIGSIDGLRVPLFETYAYSASKAALHHLTRTLAVRLGPKNVTVNAIAAGPFESKMMKATLEKFKEAIEQSGIMGRIGTPEDIVGTVIYLSSRAGAYVTGSVIPLEGGYLAKPKL